MRKTKKTNEEFVIELWSEEFGIVKRIESNSYTLELPLNGLIPGNYIIRMTSKDGIILSTIHELYCLLPLFKL